MGLVLKDPKNGTPSPFFSPVSKGLCEAAQETLSLRTSDPVREAYSLLSQWDGMLKPPKLHDKNKQQTPILRAAPELVRVQTPPADAGPSHYVLHLPSSLASSSPHHFILSPVARTSP